MEVGLTQDIWTIKAALDWCQGYLERKGDEHPRLSAEWLLAEATGKRRIELYVNFDEPLSMAERDKLRAFVTRRGKGEPLQYITGEVGFRHITVKVRPGVLIPRPETEVLVSEALALLPAPARRCAADSLPECELAALCAASRGGEEKSEAAALVGESAQSEGALFVGDPAKGEGLDFVASTEFASAHGAAVAEPESAAEVESRGAAGGGLASLAPLAGQRRQLLAADICTGSGCIACSLAYEHPDVVVHATDIEPRAIQLASENAQAAGVSDRVHVSEGDLGTCLDSSLLGAFDLVVSNPPYVPTPVMAEIPSEVADFEPALALDGGQDGLDIFRRLVPWCARALKPGGAFAFELHEGHMDTAASIAREAGFTDVRIVEDLAGRPRVLTGRKPA